MRTALTQARRSGAFVGLRDLVRPQQMPNLAAWYDVSDLGSMVVDGSNRVSLLSDKSGNSAVNVLALNGVVGNYASAPDSAALNPAGDFAGWLDLASFDYTPAALQRLMVHGGGAGDRAFFFSVNTNGTLFLQVSYNGTALLDFTSTAATGVSNFERKKIGFEVDVDNGAAGTSVNFYTADSGGAWVKLGSTVTVAGTGTLFNATTAFTIGAGSTGGDVFAGLVYRATFLTGTLSGGSAILDADFTLQSKLATSFTESSVNAATVTINSTGATGARISGTRDLYQGTAANQPVLVTALPQSTVYTSNFSAGADSWTSDAPASKVITGNVDGINGQDDWLSVARAGSAGVLDAIRASALPAMGRRTHITVRLFNPSGSAITHVMLTSDNVTDVRGVIAIAANTQVDADVTVFTNGATPTTIRARATNSAGAAVSLDVGQIFYLKTMVTEQVANSQNYIFFDGSTHYIKSPAFSEPQPISRYTVASQVSWTSGDYLWDGAVAANGAALIQTTSTPQMNLNAGSSVAANTTLVLQTQAIITEIFNTTASILGIGRKTTTTGNAGSGVPNGVTIGASGAATAANFGNITFSERLEFGGAHGVNLVYRVFLYLARKWGLANS